jgi:hypothetical protein
MWLTVPSVAQLRAQRESWHATMHFFVHHTCMFIQKTKGKQQMS